MRLLSLAALLLLPSSAAAVAVDLECRGGGRGDSREISADLELDDMSITMVWHYGARKDVETLRPFSEPAAILSNCPPAPPLAGTLNYSTASRFHWGQDVLQLPKDAASRKGPFPANVWACYFDGAWRDAHDIAVTCTITQR